MEIEENNDGNVADNESENNNNNNNNSENIINKDIEE